MEEKNFFEITGTSDNIKSELLENIVSNKVNSDILFSLLQQNQDVLSEEECFEKIPGKMSMPAGTLGFITNNANYYVNVKFLTLAFICLIFDITITNGFASFLLGLFGIDYAAIKLNDLEKCVAYKIKTEKRVSADQLKSLALCNFTHHSTKCGNYRADGTCGVWQEADVQNAINSLIEKKVIKLKEGAYEIIF